MLIDCESVINSRLPFIERFVPERVAYRFKVNDLMMQAPMGEIRQGTFR
jgi:hypothetical protein